MFTWAVDALTADDSRVTVEIDSPTADASDVDAEMQPPVGQLREADRGWMDDDARYARDDTRRERRQLTDAV